MATPRKSVRKLNVGILVTCITGFLLSYYGYFVEVAVEKDESYKAMCDISENVSCTKAFASEYGKGFGLIPKDSPLYVANPVYGLIFFVLIGTFSLSNKYLTSALVVTFGILANIGSIYLASILYKLNNICVVCISVYIVNVILLTLAIKKHRRLFRNGTNKKKKSK